jgi:F0F1-type ATP synthase assembly protein I
MRLAVRCPETLMNNEEPAKQGRGQATRLAGAGFELAATLAGACLLGYWIDRRFGCGPWGLVTCAGIGIVGGLYNLIRKWVHGLLRDIDESKHGQAGGGKARGQDDAARRP